MTDLWTKPIEVAIDSPDHFKSVKNSRDALACLLSCWPDRSGVAYTQAKRACLQAIDGTGDPGAAEKAFLLAAEEVGILHTP
nr:hypothetical protein REQ54_01073 [Rhizobium sp. Q54]